MHSVEENIKFNKNETKSINIKSHAQFQRDEPSDKPSAHIRIAN